MSNCTDCEDGSTTGSSLGPLPPCFANTCSVQWTDPRTTTPPGRIKAAVRIHPNGALECLDDANGEGMAVRILGTEAEAPAACTTSPLHRDPETNRLWVDAYPITQRATASGGGCSSTAPGGAKDATYTGCASGATAKLVNAHCQATMTVIPTISVIGAEMIGGTATYELIAGAQTIGMFTGHRIKVNHVGESTPHNITREDIATFSGSVVLDAITLTPGQSYELKVSPRVRYRFDDTESVDVTWGQIVVVLDGIINVGTGV